MFTGGLTALTGACHIIFRAWICVEEFCSSSVNHDISFSNSLREQYKSEEYRVLHRIGTFSLKVCGNKSSYCNPPPFFEAYEFGAACVHWQDAYLHARDTTGLGSRLVR